MQADLQGFVPLDRSDVMIVYRPVEIGGKTDTALYEVSPFGERGPFLLFGNGMKGSTPGTR